MQVVRKLRKNCNVSSVYYAGEFIESTEKFTSGRDALLADTKAIEEASLFVLIYPEKIVTSALVEIGYALALKKPCLVFVKNNHDLPYLLSSAANFDCIPNLPKVRIQKYTSTTDVDRILVQELDYHISLNSKLLK